MQQQRERIIGRMASCRIRVTAGEGGIAMANREQAMCDGVTAPRVALFVTAATQPPRRAPDRGENAPDENDRDREYAEAEREHWNAR